jgi:uncharacterized repeat protein (TIGR03803 family)
MSFSKLKSSRTLASFLAASVILTLAFAFTGAVIPAHAQTFSVLYNAPGGNGIGYPAAEAVSQGRNGDIYTTSEQGGTIDGTLFSFTPAGVVNIVDDTAFGYFTLSGATVGADGDLYGTDQDGGTGVCGTANCGRVYKVSPTGTLTVLHNFIGTDGQDPHAPPILGANGKYYGTAPTSNAGSGISTAYSVTSSGTFTLLHTFTSAEGEQVYGGLVQGSDGNLYGTSATGGANGFGTVFKMTTSGTVTVLHSFDGTDGNASYWPLIQASDGNYYGVTYTGGANNEGVIFKITSTGTYTILHSLNNANGDGQSPNSSLVQGTDSKLYGVTAQGPSGVNGTIFSLTTTGTFKLLHTFSGTDGANPSTPLIQDTNGVFYGATSGGGTVSTCDGGCGVIYSLNTGAKAFITLQSTSGNVGSKVGIFGQGFTAASVVKFNGVAATSVTRTGATYLTATVPSGASNGFVTVTTGSSTLTSTQKFTVHNSWASGAAMPTGALQSSAAVLGGEIYVIGGANASGTVLTEVQTYNPTTNTWSTATALPTATQHSSAAIVGDILYVFGGDNGVTSPTSAVWAYSSTTKAWTSMAPMLTARNGTVAVVEKNIIYVMGGNTGGNGNFIATVESYNPSTNTWTEEAPMLGTKDYPVGGLLGSSIVVSGGANQPGSVTGDTESYNATANSWSDLTADPTARTGQCGGAIGSVLYDASGYINNGGAATTVNESYNLSTNKWTTTLAPIPQGTMFPASAVDNGQLYCFGGWAVVNSTAINNVQIYQP